MLAPKISVVNGQLTIVVDLVKGMKQAQPSSSGKTDLIASVSEKLEQFPGVRFGLNVYRKREHAAATT